MVIATGTKYPANTHRGHNALEMERAVEAAPLGVAGPTSAVTELLTAFRATDAALGNRRENDMTRIEGSAGTV